MTTYISLASSATMFPASGLIRCSSLTPELVQARMEKVAVLSALNPSRTTTIDAIHRRFGLALPIPAEAPKVLLHPGDELFIIQAQLPRLNEGERHSDETVQSTLITFLRWRVPVHVEIKAPAFMPQRVFDEIIDHAHSIALWMRGEEHLKDTTALLKDLEAELEEAKEDGIDIVDGYLEAADTLYKICCHWYMTNGQQPVRYEAALNILDEIFGGFHEAFSPIKALDVLLAKYSRRAAGLPKDHDEERALIAPLLNVSIDIATGNL